MRALLQILLEKFLENGIDAVTFRHTKILVPGSTCVSGIVVPTLFYKMYHKAVIIEDTNLRAIQKAVDLETFCGSTTCRFDTFLKKKDYESKTGRSNDRFPKIAGKVFWFTMIVEQGILHFSCSIYRIVGCVECCNKFEREHCFAHWYKAMSYKALESDESIEYRAA